MQITRNYLGIIYRYIKTNYLIIIFDTKTVKNYKFRTNASLKATTSLLHWNGPCRWLFLFRFFEK